MESIMRAAIVAALKAAGVQVQTPHGHGQPVDLPREFADITHPAVGPILARFAGEEGAAAIRAALPPDPGATSQLSATSEAEAHRAAAILRQTHDLVEVCYGGVRDTPPTWSVRAAWRRPTAEVDGAPDATSAAPDGRDALLAQLLGDMSLVDTLSDDRQLSLLEHLLRRYPDMQGFAMSGRRYVSAIAAGGTGSKELIDLITYASAVADDAKRQVCPI